MTTLVQATAIRGVVLKATKADAALVALIPATRHYPSVTPADVVWPFIRHGTVQELPQRHDGENGTVYGSVALTAIHVFAKASAAIPDPQAFCVTVCGHMARILENIDGAVINGESALSIHVRQAETIPDGDEAGAWHGIVQYEAAAF